MSEIIPVALAAVTIIVLWIVILLLVRQIVVIKKGKGFQDWALMVTLYLLVLSFAGFLLYGVVQALQAGLELTTSVSSYLTWTALGLCPGSLALAMIISTVAIRKLNNKMKAMTQELNQMIQEEAQSLIDPSGLPKEK